MSQADITRILELISSNDVASLKAEMFDAFQYQGFDPLRIVKTLFECKTAGSVDDKTFSEDVFKMVAIGMIKGSVNTNNIDKMSDEGKKGVLELNEKYKIKMGGGKGQPSNVVTYPRVMATFPDIAVRMTAVIGGKPFNGGPMLSTRLPQFMQVQVFPAVLPRNLNDDVKRMLLTASLCYSIDQSIQISQIKEPDLKQLASTQGNFVMVGHQSPVPGSDVRKSVYNGLNIADHWADIRAVLQDYRAKVDSEFNVMSDSDFKAKCAVS
jgi:hypothetical protein